MSRRAVRSLCMSTRARAQSRLAAAKSFRDFVPSQGYLQPEAEEEALPPYLSSQQLDGQGRRVFIETYGCQMNVADTEIVRSVLQGAGYERATAADEADVVLLNTCAIREGAETRIWGRLNDISGRHRERVRRRQRDDLSSRGLIVGVLGCMGERLKGKLLEQERLVDVVCGPDAYRSLPRLLAEAASGQPALDVALSLDETYADVAPVRESSNGVSAFVSIMRGCNNMCSYCIVPHTRGRERSRPASSIAAEVAALATAGYREITLLGQNVNSYADGSGEGDAPAPLRDGFKPMVPPPRATMRFAGLMAELAAAHPEVRFRFTSPHPKDFPDELLHVLRDMPNACASLHIPAQTGSTAVLSAMRRGYSRELYFDLIHRVRELLPNASISSDFISGFCGETEADHEDTLSLMRAVRFDKAFMFAYSMREKTHAHRRLVDDVPDDVKHRRLREVIETFNAGAAEANAEEVGRHHLVLIESLSKRSESEWAGRTDTNKKVVFERRPVPDTLDATAFQPSPEPADTSNAHDQAAGELVDLAPGDYVAVRIIESISINTLRGTPLARSSITEYARLTRA